MRSLQKHHITDLYVMIDDLIPIESKPLGGRPLLLTNSELITILIWNCLMVQQRNLKQIHRWIKTYHSKEFHSIPKYSAFVDHCHRIIPLLVSVLSMLLSSSSKRAPIKFMDSTMLPVCKLVRADRHKICRGVAEFGKNHQGWHFGFKLHASIDQEGALTGFLFTPANFHDAQAMPKILDKNTIIAVGDGTYNAKAMRDYIKEIFGTNIIAPPHYKQNKKIATFWQVALLKMRPRIESVFGYLKENLNLISSFPRSVKGYFLHYIRVLIGYQLMVR